MYWCVLIIMWFCHISRNKDGNLLENICTICCIAQDKVRCGWVGTYPYLPPGDKPRSSHMKLSCAWNNREHFTRLNGCQVIRQPVFSVSLRLSGWWFVMETNPSILFKQCSQGIGSNRVGGGVVCVGNRFHLTTDFYWREPECRLKLKFRHQRMIAKELC